MAPNKLLAISAWAVRCHGARAAATPCPDQSWRSIELAGTHLPGRKTRTVRCTLHPHAAPTGYYNHLRIYHQSPGAGQTYHGRVGHSVQPVTSGSASEPAAGSWRPGGPFWRTWTRRPRHALPVLADAVAGGSLARAAAARHKKIPQVPAASWPPACSLAASPIPGAGAAHGSPRGALRSPPPRL